MHVLVVPMNPEFFPEAALLIVGVIGCAVGLRHLATHRLAKGISIVALAVVCVVLAFVMERSKFLHSPRMENLPRAERQSAETG